MGGINFKAFDLGGHEIARKVWKDYYAKVDAIVFLVDTADRERFPESSRELASLLSDDSLSDVPFLVLGNKIDLPHAGACVWGCGECGGRGTRLGMEARGEHDCECPVGEAVAGADADAHLHQKRPCAQPARPASSPPPTPCSLGGRGAVRAGPGQPYHGQGQD